MFGFCRRFAFIALLHASIALFAPAGSHELWLEPIVQDTLVLRYGHLYGDHGGAATVDYDPQFVVSATCLKTDGDRVTPPVAAHAPYRFACSGAAAYVLTSSGDWTKTPYETQNVPRPEVLMPLRSWRSFESAKLMTFWIAECAEPIGEGLEIIPLENPFVLEPGEKLGVRVTLAREPVEGAVVLYDGDPRGTTDASGTVNIRLRRPGTQFLQSEFVIPLEGDVVDEIIQQTTLTFDLKGDE